MKVALKEHDDCFEISLDAETLQDSALIVRMGMNHTRDLSWVGANAYHVGKIAGSIVIGKHRRADSSIPRRP